MIKQLSVFVENKFGRLAAITNVLRENEIDIKALSLADTSDFGVLRLVVDKYEQAAMALTEHGVTVKYTDIIAAAMEDRQGGLAYILDTLTAAEISIEYMYAFMGKQDGKAWTVIRTNDLEKTVEVLHKAGIKTLDEAFKLEI